VIEPTIRPATLDDAVLAADLMTDAYPSEPTDPILTRFRWEHAPDDWSIGRYIAEVEGTPVAFVSWAHGPWVKAPERFCEIEVWLDQARQDPDLMAWLIDWVGQRAVEQEAYVLYADAAEDEPRYVAQLKRQGFERDRSDRVWELDLRRHGERFIEEARAAKERAAEMGIVLTTLAEWDDPDKLRQLHALNELTHQDVPHTVPILPVSFENFVERTGAPDLRFDRYWIALDGDRLVALSFLRFPPVRGPIWTGYTCCHPEYRGRGLARAVKLQSVAQAVALGIPSIRTANDTENAPMLRINEALGYELRPGFVSHLKRVRT